MRARLRLFRLVIVVGWWTLLTTYWRLRLDMRLLGDHYRLAEEAFGGLEWPRS